MTTEITATLPPIPEQASSCSPAALVNWNSTESPRLEKRREPRYETCEPVDLYLLDMNNLHLSGMLRDISKSGMRIELDMPLKVGDRMEVLLQNNTIVLAAVRYCRRTGESHQVGCVIDDVFYPKAASPLCTFKTAGSESAFQQVTQHIYFGEKRPEDSREPRASGRAFKGAIDQVVSSRDPLKTQNLAVKKEGPGAHVDRNDIDNLLGLRLSQTKTALLERHLASCDQCLDLLMRMLEDRASSPSASPKCARGQI
jgi:PilZ domain